MTNHYATDLHLLTSDEADTLMRRARALAKFEARYRHNPESQRAMVGALRRLARTFSADTLTAATFPWEVLVDEDLAKTMWDSVADRYSPKTAQRDASALKILLKHLYKEQLLSYTEYRDAASFEVKAGPERPPAGHYLSEDDLLVIARTCLHGAGHLHTRIRDLALLLTLASTGVRQNEVTGVAVADTHLGELRIWVARPKGGRPRNATLHSAAVEALQAWLHIRGTNPGPLFVPLSRTGRPLLDHGELSTRQVLRTIQGRASEAGYTGITPHDLRRFMITTLLQRQDITMVATLAGHTNPATTAKYDRRPFEHQREAIETLHLPRFADLWGATPDATADPHAPDLGD